MEAVKLHGCLGRAPIPPLPWRRGSMETGFIQWFLLHALSGAVLRATLIGLTKITWDRSRDGAGEPHQVPRVFEPRRKTEAGLPGRKDFAPSAEGRSPKRSEDGNVYIGGQKFIWVPVRSGDHTRSRNMDEPKAGCAIINNSVTGSGGKESVEGLKIGKSELTGGAVHDLKTGGVTRDLGIGVQQQQQGSDATGKENSRSEASMQKSSEKLHVTGMNNRWNGDISEQHRTFSAGSSMFRPRAAAPLYRRSMGGSIIRSVAPGTKPEPRWCPTGLTHTQKRRVQQLRALEIKEEKAEKKRDEWFNQTRPMAPANMTWKEKRIAKEEGSAADDMIIDENSENKIDNAGNFDVSMVFILPTEFRAPETEVAELDLGPKNAIFVKPEEPGQHLKPLFIKGHVDGKPVGRMLVDGGAGVNIMPFSVFSKLGRDENDLKKTNMGLSGFSGELSEAKGVISMELTIGSKTIPTAFFVVDVKGRYNILLGRNIVIFLGLRYEYI